MIDEFYAPAAAAHARGESTAGEVAGDYLPTRRLHSGEMQIFGAMEAMSVAAEGDALVIELESGPTRWLASGPDRFVEERTRLPLAVARDASGRIVRLGSPLLNSVSQYEPAPLGIGHLPLLVMAAAVLTIQAVAMPPIGWLLRRLRKKKRTEPTSVSRARRRAATAAIWLIVITTAGWTLSSCWG